MQPSDSTPTGPSASRLSSFSKTSLNGDSTGFSHGAFHSNQPSITGYGDRHPQRNLPSISTGRIGSINQTGPDMQTPGTAFDMNFTPLLPSQLLLGSPFQPGSPNAFGSPQFQNFSNFQSNGAQQQPQQPQIGSPIQQPMSPQLYQSIMSPTGISALAELGSPALDISNNSAE